MSRKQVSQVLSEIARRKSPAAGQVSTGQVLVEVIRRYKMAVNPALEAFLFANESAWGTFQAPSKGLYVESCDVGSNRGLEIPDTTGAGRGRKFAWLGEKPVAGKLVLLAWPQYVGSLLKALFTTVNTDRQETTTAYRHKLLLDDTADLGSISMEKQYGGSSGTTQFIKGAVCTNLTISAAVKAALKLSLGYVAKDEAWAGGNWEDGTAAPAAATNPVPYAAGLAMPFKFHEGAVYKGGSLALTDGEIVVTGGTAIAYIEACEIAIDMGLDSFFGLNNTPNVVALRPGGRKVSLKADLDWQGVDNAYTLAHRAGTETVWQLKFVGPVIASTYYYEFIVTLPRVIPATAPATAIQGAKTRRKQPITYEALVEDTTTHADIGLVIQTTDTTL